jgi:hypothetical protein
MLQDETRNPPREQKLCLRSRPRAKRMMMRVGLEPTQINLLAPEASALTARPSHLIAYSNLIR